MSDRLDLVGAGASEGPLDFLVERFDAGKVDVMLVFSQILEERLAELRGAS